MTADESKLEILKKVENGTLSVEEGADLIGILEGAENSQPAEGSGLIPPMEYQEPVEPSRTSNCWKAAWSMVLTGGAIITAFSAFRIFTGYQKAGFGWGFWLSWIPFIIGLLITIFGWILMESPWMHVRVRSEGDNKPTNFVISMPLPLKLARWVFNNFGQYMPEEVREKGIEAMIDEVEQSLQRGEPFQIEVEDKDDGDQVYIQFSKS